MPICKQTRVRETYPILNYLMTQPGAELLDTNCVYKTPVMLSREFQVIIQRNRYQTRRYTELVVNHSAINFDQLNTISREDKIAIAHRYIELIGFNRDDNQYVVIEHPDPEHPHIHIAVNQVQIDGNATRNTFYGWRRAEKAMREIEKEFGLPQLQNSWETDVRAPSPDEIHKSNRDGLPIPRVIIQQTLNELIPQCHNLDELQTMLRSKDIDLAIKCYPATTRKKGKSSSQATGNSTDESLGSAPLVVDSPLATEPASPEMVYALVYSYGGLKFSGSKLGRRYGYPAMQQVWSTADS